METQNENIVEGRECCIRVVFVGTSGRHQLAEVSDWDEVTNETPATKPLFERFISQRKTATAVICGTDWQCRQTELRDF